MQAVILAAGISSRFYPYTQYHHKSLIKIFGKPIVLHTLESVRSSGIKEVILVVSGDSEIKRIFGNGKNFGVNIQYAVQDKPSGAGDGLLLCEKLIKGDFFLLNASRIDFSDYKNLMGRKKTEETKAVLLARKQDNLEKYGVLKVEKDRVLGLVEKPQKGKEPSSLRLIGIYLFSKDFLKILKETGRDHYRLEKAIDRLCGDFLVSFVETQNEVPSLKYSWDLLEMKNALFKIAKKSIKRSAKIAESAEIAGNAVIEDGAIVMEGAKIKGPCFIGRNSIIGNNVVLRGGTDIEENCVIGANMEIKNSLIMSGTKTHSGYIGDSIVGQNCRIGADFSTANVRLDRGKIKVKVNEEEVKTGLRRLGVITGNNGRIGIKSSTMPGVIIGNNSLIGPSTVVLKNVPDSTKYYTKFQEVIEKK